MTEPAKSDLEWVAKELFTHLSTEYRTVIAEELKLTENKNASQSDLASIIEHKLHGMDQARVCRLLVGMSLLDATFNTYSPQGASQLNAVAKRYRVNTDKIRETVTAEFADRRKKQEQRRKERAAKKQVSMRRKPAA